MEQKKVAILEALRRFARQRPGMDPMNYGDPRAYRNESASVTRDLRHAEALLNAVEWRDGISADDILAAARGSYSGRLSIECDDSSAVRVSYCTGQYFPTEYRRAVCVVLSSALWDYWRADIKPDYYRVSCEDDSHNRIPATSQRFENKESAQAYADSIARSRFPYVESVYAGGLSAGDYLRKIARRELPRGIANRYFR